MANNRGKALAKINQIRGKLTEISSLYTDILVDENLFNALTPKERDTLEMNVLRCNDAYRSLLKKITV